MNYWGYLLEGLGVAIGIIAGIVVAIVLQKIINWKKEQQKVKNLIFELQMNIKKIDDLLEETQKYRNAVNADNLSIYHGYFDLSKYICGTALDMLKSGLLYKYLSLEQIERLQYMSSELSIYSGNYMNNQLQGFKVNFDKVKAILAIDFWESKFKEDKKNLIEIRDKLG